MVHAKHMKTGATRREGNMERESGGIRLRLHCRQGVRIREAFRLTRLARERKTPRRPPVLPALPGCTRLACLPRRWRR